MPRPRHIFTPQEIALVRDAYINEGSPAIELAQKLGVSYNHFRDAKARGDFGTDLPRKRGGGKTGIIPEEADTPDNIMGVERKEIDRRMDAIKSTWSDDERNWRIRYNPGAPQNKSTGKSGKKRHYPGYGAG